MEGKKHIPAIRFKGFNDEWEEKQINDIAITEGGCSIEHEFCSNGRYKVISIGSYSEDSKYVDQGLRINCNSRTKDKILSSGDLTMVLNDKTSSGRILGRVLLIRQDNLFIYNQRTERIIPLSDKYSSLFLYHYFNAPYIREKILKLAQGNTQIYVNWSSVKDVKYLLTTKSEQQRIGSFFEKIDTIISGQQAKLEKLKNIKASLLNKMFPAKGEKKPAIRFKGFKDEWEEKKLGEIGETYTGLSGKTKDDFGHGNAKFITYMNVYLNSVAKVNMVEQVELDTKQNEVAFGDIFFTTSSETPDEVGMSCVLNENMKDTYLNSFCFGFRPKMKNDNYYMAYMLRSKHIREKIIILAQGISRYNISKNKLIEIQIPLPNFPEQQRIGSFFEKLDKLISLQEQKITKLQNIKKAFLAKMFA